VPEEEHEKMFFLIEKINAFNHDINSLIEGEEFVGEDESRLFTKIRNEFHKWSCVIEKKFQQGYKAIYKQIEKFENRYRGRELPGFVNYKTFEIIIKQQIKELEEPAVYMLHMVTDMVQAAFTDISEANFAEFFNLYRTTKSKIEDIKFELEKEAEKSIRLHFQMEQIVYCQDQVYQRALQRVREKVADQEKNKKINSMSSEEVSSVNISLSEIFEHLLAYRQVSLRASLGGGFHYVSLSCDCLSLASRSLCGDHQPARLPGLSVSLHGGIEPGRGEQGLWLGATPFWCHQAVRPWPSYLTSLSLSFLLCKAVSPHRSCESSVR